ncbi:(2Fe-2S)-binding protein [Archangium primigenium]|uniref:(2Fe-2S)-binding protein n=1 Tax=[Archangium] primigenium TaxID=2792470 RepID=UPI001958C7E6|nr:(2Fe-2S)-binding protein [Archangium primigenium]MBM7118773.1 (2Fe-2S)-binding protein [Archangium primigenium]
MTDPKSLPPEDASRPEAPASDVPEGATRREFIATATTITVGGALLLEACGHTSAAPPPSAPGPTPGAPPPGEMEVHLTVNGQPRALKVDPRTSLLDALRERMDLTGTKKGCDHGQCGACTVLVNGRRELSCLSLALMQEGAEVRTVEGLAQGETLHPMQEAFLTCDALQCGYCTPGQIMSAVGLLSEPCGTADADVREAMSGNICRCSAYPNIVAAIQQVRRQPQ